MNATPFADYTIVSRPAKVKNFLDTDIPADAEADTPAEIPAEFLSGVWAAFRNCTCDVCFHFVIKAMTKRNFTE
jgi:hypothetical protein